MGLCGCFPSCACMLNIVNNGLLSLSGNGDVATGGWTLAGIETVFAGFNSDGTILVTPGGSYGHAPSIDTVIDPASTSIVSKSVAGLRIDSVIASVLDTDSVDLTLAGDVLSADVRIDPAGSAPVSVTVDGLKIDCCPGDGNVELSGNWGDGHADYALCADTNGAEIYEDSNGQIRANIIRGFADTGLASTAVSYIPTMGVRYRTATVILTAPPCQNKHYSISLNHSAFYGASGLIDYSYYYRVNLGVDNLYSSGILPGSANAGGQLNANFPISEQMTHYNNVIPAGGSVQYDISAIYDNRPGYAIGNVIAQISLSTSLHGIVL